MSSRLPPPAPNPLLAATFAVLLALSAGGCGSALEPAGDASVREAPSVLSSPAEVAEVAEVARPADVAVPAAAPGPGRQITKPIVELVPIPAIRR